MVRAYSPENKATRSCGMFGLGCHCHLPSCKQLPFGHFNREETFSPTGEGIRIMPVLHISDVMIQLGLIHVKVNINLICFGLSSQGVK